jgi:branched-chain amino acid transport system permease protein
VFNFAQGAMVLFAALAMARFAEWIPWMLGIDSLSLANLHWRLCWPLACMFVVAWVIERLGAAPLGESRRHDLADGHLGHHLFPGRLWARPSLAADIYKIDIGMPKEPCDGLSKKPLTAAS